MYPPPTVQEELVQVKRGGVSEASRSVPFEAPLAHKRELNPSTPITIPLTKCYWTGDLSRIVERGGIRKEMRKRCQRG